MKKEILHYKYIEEIIRYLEFIKNSAMHYSDSVTDIIRQNQQIDIGKKYINYCDNGAEPISAWHEAVNSSDITLTADEKKYIIAFMSDICSSSMEKLEEQCNKSITELIEIKNQLLKEKDKKIKLSTVTTVSFSLLIILIFI